MLYGAFISITLVALAIAFYHVIKGSLPKEKLDTLVELFKYGVVTMAITTVGAIVSDQFKERDQDVKELEYFHKYVDHATRLDGHDRLQLSKFLATVAPAGLMRDAWRNYYDTVRVEYMMVLERQANVKADSLGGFGPFDREKFADEEYKIQVMSNFDRPLISSSGLGYRPTVYIQFCGDHRKGDAEKMRTQMNEMGWTAPGIEKLSSGCDNTIRYFHDEDKVLAELLNQLLDSTFTVKRVRMTAPKAQVEVWIAE